MPSKEEVEKAGRNDDFDWFRKNYEKLTFDDLKQLYGIWLEKHPAQEFYDPKFVIDCFTRIVSETGKETLNVVELGGYNGRLALEVFRAFPKLDWLNVEIISHSPASGLENYRYMEHVLTNQIWEENLDITGADVFASGDTLEHFSDHEMKKIVEYISRNQPSYLILKIPVSGRGQNWNGITASHLLQIGRKEIKKLFSASYEIVTEETQTPFKGGGIRSSVDRMFKRAAILAATTVGSVVKKPISRRISVWSTAAERWNNEWWSSLWRLSSRS